MKPKRNVMKSGPRRERPSKSKTATWVLRLYVAGKTQKAMTALTNLKDICEEQLKGTYRIEVIDIRNKPQLASDNQILAVPTLVRNHPRPVRSIIGDLSDTERVLVGLDLIPRGA